MNKDEFEINDMTLEDEEKPEKLDMDLETPSVTELENKIKRIFSDQEIIEIKPDLTLLKMASGNYRLNNTCLKSLEANDLKLIDNFLKGKEGK